MVAPLTRILDNGSMSRTIAIVVNEASFFLSHRLPIAQAAVSEGYNVSIWCPPSVESSRLEKFGLCHTSMRGFRGRAGLLRELSSFAHLFYLAIRHRPDLLHLVTSKPILFGGIVARVLRIPALVAVSGLGFVFSGEGRYQRIVRYFVVGAYRFALKNPRSIVIFQNADDKDRFARLGIGSADRAVMIKGSGTDLSAFNPDPQKDEVKTFMLPARLLVEKGVQDFVAAARILRERGYKARFILQGNPDAGNPSAIKESELRGWNAEGVIIWRPYSEQVGLILSKADVVVLPSYYREGLPKTLIDAAAAGRASITTDWPGCRDAIVAGKTGLLCKPRNPKDLAEKMIWFLENPDKIVSMGQNARKHAERNFNVGTVSSRHLDLYRELLSGKGLNVGPKG